MSRIAFLLTTSIGRKQLMAVTGLVWVLFLVGHLSGNLLIFAGPENFNAYADFLSSQWWLIPVEIVLGLILLTHVYLALRLTAHNRAARGSRYAMKDSSDATMASRSMILTGIVVFIFLVVHLLNFKFGGYEEHPQRLYGLVVDKFEQPVFSGLYVAAMVVLGIHLVHAIQSVFQTFGWNHPVYTIMIKRIGIVIAIVLSVGFASLPLWLLLMKGGA